MLIAKTEAPVRFATASQIMIGSYIVVAVGFSLAITYVFLIRHILNSADDSNAN